MDTRLVDINELSQRLSIPKGTLYNWVYLRRIPFIKAGRSLRFDADEVIQSLPIPLYWRRSAEVEGSFDETLPTGLMLVFDVLCPWAAGAGKHWHCGSQEG